MTAPDQVGLRLDGDPMAAFQATLTPSTLVRSATMHFDPADVVLMDLELEREDGETEVVTYVVCGTLDLQLYRRDDGQ